MLYGRPRGGITTSPSITMNSLNVTLNIQGGGTILESQSPMSPNSSAAATATSISTGISQRLIYILNGNDRFQSLRQYKIVYASGNLLSVPELSSCPAFKLRYVDPAFLLVFKRVNLTGRRCLTSMACEWIKASRSLLTHKANSPTSFEGVPLPLGRKISLFQVCKRKTRRKSYLQSQI